MKRHYILGPAVAALLAAGCGASAKPATAPERAAEQAEQDKQDAQEKARDAREQANRERQESQEATRAERGAERDAQFASQRAAVARAQAAREAQPSQAAPVGAAEAQANTPGKVEVARTAVLFQPDSAELSADAKAKLDPIASTARARGAGYVVSVEGYTDDSGPEATNKQLSEHRAQEVAVYLESQGVARDRIARKALGSMHPASREGTERARALNRRVEVSVQPVASPAAR